MLMRNNSIDSARDGSEVLKFDMDTDTDLDSGKSSLLSSHLGYQGRNGVAVEDQGVPGSSTQSHYQSIVPTLVVTSMTRHQIQPQNNAPSRGADTEKVSWGDLPRKDQLIVITLARLSEPLVQTSLQVSALIFLDVGEVHTNMFLQVVHVLHVEVVQPRPS